MIESGTMQIEKIAKYQGMHNYIVPFDIEFLSGYLGITVTMMKDCEEYHLRAIHEASDTLSRTMSGSAYQSNDIPIYSQDLEQNGNSSNLNCDAFLSMVVARSKRQESTHW